MNGETASLARRLGVTRQRADQLLHPDRNRARSTASKALLAGKIVRPPECSMCGETTVVEMHHPNYDERLRIVWLCRPCHMKTHVSKRERERGAGITISPGDLREVSANVVTKIPLEHRQGHLKAYCKRGHERTPANLYPPSNCKVCTLLRAKLWGKAHKDQKAAQEKLYREAHREQRLKQKKLYRESRKVLSGAV